MKCVFSESTEATVSGLKKKGGEKKDILHINKKVYPFKNVSRNFK